MNPVVAYLGPAGTFTHAAAQQYFGPSVTLEPKFSIDEVFEAVGTGSVSHGVVPVENSTEGAVNTTQDCLLDTSLTIVGEVELAISHQLMGNESDTVERIASHKQSLAQCKNWLREHYPTAKLVECASNTQAVELARDNSDTAAIASRMAAELYGLPIIASDIQDRPNNRTRFLIITAGPVDLQSSGDDKSSMIVYTSNKPGALFRLLEPFENLQISLTKIETRPSKMEAWEYVFFIDFEGHRLDTQVVALFERLEKYADEIKFLGSYPRHRES